MSAREILPMRRGLQRIATEFAGFAYTVDFHARPAAGGAGEIAEIFINAAKSANATEAIARDAAIVISIGLQYGTPVDAMRKAMTRDGQGAPLSIIGHVLDLLAAETGARDA